MLFHDLDCRQFLAGFQVVYAESRGSGAAEGFVNSEGRRVSALGQARGAGVQAVDSVGVLFGGKDVRMAGKIHVGLVVAEQVGIVQMTVAQKQAQSVFLKFGVVREAWKSEHHLVYFGISVATNNGNLVLKRAQELNNSLRVVSAGQRISGSVIKKVAQKENAVAFELVEVRKCHFAGIGRTMNIRKNKSTH